MVTIYLGKKNQKHGDKQEITTQPEGQIKVRTEAPEFLVLLWMVIPVSNPAIQSFLPQEQGPRKWG